MAPKAKRPPSVPKAKPPSPAGQAKAKALVSAGASLVGGPRAATPELRSASAQGPRPASSKAGAKAVPKAGVAKAGAAPPPSKAGSAAAAAAAAMAADEEAARARKAEEEEARAREDAATEQRRLAEEMARAAEAEAEVKRLAALASGEVTVKYSMYAEKFQIENHKLTAAAIDELYCLSDVMPGCFIHLAEREYGYNEEQVFMKEDPVGTFLGLMAGETYWCYVQQDAEQEKKDVERMRKQWAGVVVEGGIGDRGKEAESCSCGDGAPCTNPEVCKDWDNRFANAIKAGGNPLLFVGGTQQGSSV